MKENYEALETLYHEPNRLAIMTELCAAEDGVTFTELKARCSLTDGNLSRHLQSLEKGRAVEIRKEFIGAKPRTTVFPTTTGRQSFLDYLTALEEVLHEAARRITRTETTTRVLSPLLRPKKA